MLESNAEIVKQEKYFVRTGQKMNEFPPSKLRGISRQANFCFACESFYPQAKGVVLRCKLRGTNPIEIWNNKMSALLARRIIRAVCNQT